MRVQGTFDEDVARLTNSVPDGSHPIATGATVSIFRIFRRRAPLVEGRAVIKDVAHGRHRYRVQFIGDLLLKERIVHPDYQHDPERMVEIMRDLWRASATEAFDDFFPEHSK